VILIKNIYTLWGRKQRTDRRTDGQTDMARSTPLLIPDQEYIYFMGSETLPSAVIKNIYTLWGRKRFLLPVTYFPTNLGVPFTLRVTVIMTLLTQLPRKLTYFLTSTKIITTTRTHKYLSNTNSKNNSHLNGKIPQKPRHLSRAICSPAPSPNRHIGP